MSKRHESALQSECRGALFGGKGSLPRMYGLKAQLKAQPLRPRGTCSEPSGNKTTPRSAKSGDACSPFGQKTKQLLHIRCDERERPPKGQHRSRCVACFPKERHTSFVFAQNPNDSGCEATGRSTGSLMAPDTSSQRQAASDRLDLPSRSKVPASCLSSVFKSRVWASH